MLIYNKRICVLNCLQVLVGDNATRLAVRLLGNIAQGRGASLPLDTVIKTCLLLIFVVHILFIADVVNVGIC